MTKFGFFTRFTLAYIVTMAIAGISMSLLGFEKTSSLNTPILLGISYWVFYSYMNKNERIAEGGEKWSLVFLALIGEIITTILLGIPTLLANEVPIKFLFIGLSIVIPLHLLLLVAVNYGVKKMMLKQRPELAKS